MKPQSRIGVNLSWLRLTVILLIDVAVLVAARHWPAAGQAAVYAWWVGVGIAALVLIVGVVTYRRTPLIAVLAGRLLDRFVDPQALLSPAAGFDHARRFSHQPIGIRHDQSRLVSVIEVVGVADPRDGRHHGSATLPLSAIAAALRPFDVRLDAIDIVSVAAPQTSGTWLILRMNPQRNVAAVASRDSVAATLAATTERLAQQLDGTRCIARALTADEITAVDAAVLAGLDPDHVRGNRRRLKNPQRDGAGESVTSFWVSPQDITEETLDQLWEADTNAAAVTLRVTPGGTGTRVSAWVRYHSDRRLPKDIWNGLNRLTGRQLAAVCASLPNPVARSPLEVPGRVLGAAEDLAVPVGTHR